MVREPNREPRTEPHEPENTMEPHEPQTEPNRNRHDLHQARTAQTGASNRNTNRWITFFPLKGQHARPIQATASTAHCVQLICFFDLLKKSESLSLFYIPTNKHGRHLVKKSHFAAVLLAPLRETEQEQGTRTCDKRISCNQPNSPCI